MPSIVVINDEGSVLYQNVVEDVQDVTFRPIMRHKFSPIVRQVFSPTLRQ